MFITIGLVILIIIILFFFSNEQVLINKLSENKFIFIVIILICIYFNISPMIILIMILIFLFMNSKLRDILREKTGFNLDPLIESLDKNDFLHNLFNNNDQEEEYYEEEEYDSENDGTPIEDNIIDENTDDEFNKLLEDVA